MKLHGKLNAIPCHSIQGRIQYFKNWRQKLFWGSNRDFSIAGIARLPLGHTGTVKPHTCIEYINIMIVQQTYTILDDCQRLHYR